MIRHARKMLATSTALVLVIMSMTACTPPSTPEPPAETTAPVAPAASEAAPAEPALTVAADVPQEALVRARTAADGLMTQLKSELVAALDAGGPVNAISVCAERAPAIAATHQADDLAIRRVSSKVRNPADRPDAFEVARLDAMLAAHVRDGKLPDEIAEITTDADGTRTLRYMKPITIAKPCLACHGGEADVAPEVVAKLRELYPGDEATGYGQGDLRGAVTVQIALQ